MALKSAKINLTGNERTFEPDEFIVSKTNLKGHITYANNVFLRISGFTEDEIIDAPHSLVRHPDMPRCVFKLLWDRIQNRKEIFAYVVNTSKNGDHYWVVAHVTPSFDADGNVIGFHSNRRKPEPEKISAIKGIYNLLLKEEASCTDRKAGMEKSGALLTKMFTDKGVTYDEFVLTL